MSISFSGLASGLDTSSWVTSLTQLRQAKITTLEAQKTSIVAAQSTLQGIRAYFSSFRSSIEKITDSKFKVASMDIFSKKLANVSNSAVLSATAKSNAAEGSYEVKVNNVATQTQVKSGYRYKTMLVSTTQATTSSVLKNIGIGYGTNPETGITSGTVEITHDGVKSSIYVSTNETMDSFLGKLHEVGIEADFDNDTGIFSIGVNAEDINDIGNTNILNKLKISNINYGYTGNQLKIEETHEEYHQATEETLLSELGVHTGTITLSTAHGTYEVTLDNDDTIGSLVSALNEEGIEAAFSNGVFSINNATIDNDGTTHLIEAFGLTDPSVANQTQQSDGLTYQNVYTTTATANLGTLLCNIDGVEMDGQETIVVQSADGTNHTLTVDTSTTIGGLVDQMNAVGINLGASFNENTGVLSINNGWIVDGGTFDVEAAFGLQYTGVAAMVTGSQLTVTTTTVTGATGATKLKDLTTAVESGTIKVTDTAGNTHNLVIDANKTIDEFTADIRALGLGASFNNSTGVLTLVGGSYTTSGLSNADKSNILNVFFGEDTLTPSDIDSATATSQALRASVSETHLAVGTTTLGELNLDAGSYVATFKTGNTEVLVGVDRDQSLNDLVSALRAGGIDAEFDSETHKFKVTDGEFIGVTGSNFAEIMDFTSTITGRYATSNIVRAQNITTANELTSSSAVYYTDYVTTTVTSNAYTTGALEASSAPLTYQSIVTTVTGGTVGVEITSSASVTYDSVTTAGRSQTATLNSTTTVTTPGSTTTVGYTVTTGELTYNSVSIGTTGVTTTGITTTSGVMYTTTTTPKTQTSGTLTYDVTVPGASTTTTTGQTMTGNQVVIGDVTSPCSQTGSILTYTTTSTTPSYTETTGVAGTYGTVLQYDTVITTVTGPTTAGITTTLTLVSNTLQYNSVTPASTETYLLGQTSDVIYTGNTIYSRPIQTITTYANRQNSSLNSAYIVESSGVPVEVTLLNTGTSETVSFTMPSSTSLSNFKLKLEEYGIDSEWRQIMQGWQIDLLADENPEFVVIGTTNIQSQAWHVGENYSYTATPELMSEDTLIMNLYYNATGEQISRSYEYTVTIMSGETYTLDVGSSVGAVVEQLIALGYDAGVTNGRFWFSPTDDMNNINKAVVGFDRALEIALGMTGKLGDGGTYVEGYADSNVCNIPNHTIVMSLTSSRANGKVKFSDKMGSTTLNCGFTESIVVTSTSGESITVGPNATLAQFLNKIKTDLGVNFNIYTDGNLITTKSSNTLYDTISIVQTGGVNSPQIASCYSLDSYSSQSQAVPFSPIDIGYGRTYTYTESTTTYLPANLDTTFVEMGIPQDRIGYIYTNTGTITIHATDTVGEFISNAATQGGLTVSLNNGYLSIANNGSHYITGATVEAGKMLNLTGPLSANPLENVTYTVTPEQTTYTPTITIAAGDTQMSALGLTANATFVNQAGVEYTVLTTDSVSSLVSTMTNAGLNASFNSTTGAFQFVQTSDHYVTDMTQELQDILGITVGVNNTYNTVAAGGTTTSITATASFDTTLSQLGFNQQGTIVFGDGTSVVVDGSWTIQDIDLDGMYGHVLFELNANGQCVIYADSPHTETYIESMTPELASALGLLIGEDHTYDTTGGPIDGDTTLGELGLTSSSYIYSIVTDTTTVSFNQDSTIDDILDALNDTNNFYATVNNGVLQINPLNGHYIDTQNSSQTLLQHLGNLHDGYSTTTIQGQNTIQTYTAQGGERFDELGMRPGSSAVVQLNNGNSITLTSEDDLMTFIEFLEDNGIYTNLSNGVLTVGNPNNTNYITYSELAPFIGIRGGEGYSYTTAQSTANNATTLSQLGLAAGSYEIKSFNTLNSTTTTLTVTESTNLAALCSALQSTCGLTATLAGGVLTISPNGANVLIDMDGTLSGKLGGIKVGEHYSYEVDISQAPTTTTLKTVTSATTLQQMNMNGNWATIITDTSTVSVSATASMTELVNTLNSAGLNATFNEGVLTIKPKNGHYLKSLSPNLEAILGIKTGYGESYGTNVTNPSTTTNTSSATTETTLSQMGLNGDYMLELNNGNSTVLTGNSTVSDLQEFLTNNGITSSLSNGKITIGDSSNTNFITYSELSAIGIRAGEGISYNSNTQTVNATTATQLSTLGLGNGSYSIRTNNGTVTVTGTNNIQDVIDELNSIGFTASLNAQNKFVITPQDTNYYIESMTPDLATALGRIETGKGISYNVVGEVSTTTIHTATLDTTLSELGLTNNAFIITHNGTVTAETDDTLTSLMGKLTGAGISSSYNTTTGIFTIGSTTDTNYVTDMSDELSRILGNIVVGENASFQINTQEAEQEIITPNMQTVSESQTFGDIGITSGGVINLSNGNTVTVNSDTTISSFLSDINGKGITATLTNGIFNLRPQNNTYVTGCSGENVLSAMNIVESTYSVTVGTLGTTKLKDLKSNTDSPLGITTGLIKAYKNGISSNILIDENSTLEELENQLSNYNIQMVYSSGSSGKIYFTSSGDSYLSEIEGESNLLTALGISTWTANKNTSSKTLEYGFDSDQVITGSTKILNLKNADGSSVGITEGKFIIRAAGIRYEGSIGVTTTVDDLFSQLSYYGFSGSINSNGQITLNTSNDNTYLELSDPTLLDHSNIVQKLFPNWTFGNIYTSDSMDVTDINTVKMTSETRLKDIDQGTYKAGKFVVSSSRTGDTVINLSENATVGDFMAALAYHGFNSYIEDGRLIVQNDGYTTLNNYNVPSEASNVLSLLGLDTSAWEQPGYYTGTNQTTTNYNTVYEAATRDTKLSDLRYANGNELNITTGEYWVYTNGVKHAVNLSSTDITLDNFMNVLSGYGITTTLNTEDGQSILKIVGSGNSYVATSDAAGASNVVQKLFGSSGPSTMYDYSGYLRTTELVSTTMIADLGTSVSDYDHGNVKSEGVFALSVDGNYSEINITSYETFGSLIEKFERAGVTATLTNGVFRLETGNKTFVVDNEHTTSNLISNLGLHYSDNLGGFAASSDAVTQTTTTIEDRTLSVAKYADYNTQLGLLNISSGTLSVYRNGAKQLITIDNTETFSQLRSRLQDAFGDVDIDFSNGKLRFFSTNEGVDVQVGSTNDTSNMSSICGFSQDENGYIVSARELYKVNASSVIMTSDLFRYGDVTAGTFVVGDETFTINSDTTIQNIVAQINSSEKANASAYWDSVDGKLVISSRTTGASMVNVEAGTSNFTDILGLTNSEWENDGSLKVTRIRLDSQELGNNAKFSINGTNFQSASNVVTSDISRIQGLTLNLKSSSMGDTVTVTIGKDTEAVTEAVGEFVEAYNGLVENVDAELSTGVLKDQSTLKFIKQQIRNLLVNTFAGATTFRNLAALGISTSMGNAVTAGDVSNAGIEYLYFDAEKFMEGYNKDADAVKNMLVGSDETPGILLQVESIVENALTTGSGYFSAADKSYSDKINSINEKIKKANQAIEAYRARLESKFQSMDLLISQMQNQYNSFLNSSSATSAVTSYFI